MGVIKLVDSTGLGQHQTPEDALKEALADIDNDGVLENGKKILILALGDEFELEFYQAGMSVAEMITLCEMVKANLMRELGHPADFIED